MSDFDKNHAREIIHLYSRMDAVIEVLMDEICRLGGNPKEASEKIDRISKRNYRRRMEIIEEVDPGIAADLDDDFTGDEED